MGSFASAGYWFSMPSSALGARFLSGYSLKKEMGECAELNAMDSFAMIANNERIRSSVVMRWHKMNGILSLVLGSALWTDLESFGFR